MAGRPHATITVVPPGQVMPAPAIRLEYWNLDRLTKELDTNELAMRWPATGRVPVEQLGAVPAMLTASASGDVRKRHRRLSMALLSQRICEICADTARCLLTAILH